MSIETGILVLGANGQLGMEFRDASLQHSGFDWHFHSRSTLPIEDITSISAYCRQHQISYLINCAAYTAVDKAEQEKVQAMLINAEMPGKLAGICREQGMQLVHFSTDYVFDGSAGHPYKESDPTHPINAYGESKHKGEELALNHDPKTMIIRTSWLYSRYGQNFVKTMLRLMQERDELRVVSDQQGSPTHAGDLAHAVCRIISKNMELTGGIYHFANEGITTWYHFAEAIRQEAGYTCRITPIPSSDYPTPAKRPHYSVLDTQKIRVQFRLEIPYWKDSLTACIRMILKP